MSEILFSETLEDDSLIWLCHCHGVLGDEYDYRFIVTQQTSIKDGGVLAFVEKYIRKSRLFPSVNTLTK